MIVIVLIGVNKMKFPFCRKYKFRPSEVYLSNPNQYWGKDPNITIKLLVFGEKIKEIIMEKGTVSNLFENIGLPEIMKFNADIKINGERVYHNKNISHNDLIVISPHIWRD